MVRFAYGLVLSCLVLLVAGCLPDPREKSRGNPGDSLPLMPDTAGLRQNQPGKDTLWQPGNPRDTLLPDYAFFRHK
ncbi:hypothetical protein [Robiginitalea sp. SC105]|uniref:hypothetical protein n=1 Tax=Robiginitalea sp. SC105 TaxID=2762332 RepID=UPI00163B0AE1|nr:hypothetical protein [Robiginitalea sp. SC105]MBC2838710.1 hypothetical protein [Robiginitalea sp. SC105]